MKTKLMFLLALGLGSTAVALGEPRIVKGQVLSDSDGEPMIGVAISEKGTTNGTITDADGNFSINVEDGAILTISYMGYTTQNVKPVGNSPIKIELVEDSKMLDDVIVVGYGTMKKSDLAGSVISVDRESMMKRVPTNIGQALQGSAAGVIVTLQDGAPDANAAVRIRGVGTLTGETRPLYVVDGIIVGNDANYLNPSDIENIEVLKDASATAIYGSRAANGVVMITTKQGEKGKMNVSVTADWGFQNLPYEIETLDINTYAKSIREARANDGNGLNNKIWDSQYDGKRNNINWQDQMTRMGLKQQYGISGTGGNDKTQYNFSIGYLDNQGIIVNSKYNRINARASVKSQVNKYLSFGGDIAYSCTESRGSNRGLGNNGNLSSHRDLAQMAPTLDYIDGGQHVKVNVVNPDGTYGSGYTGTSDGWEGNTRIYQNVYATQKELTGKARNHRMAVNPYLDIKLLDLDNHKITWHTLGSYIHTAYDQESFTKLYHRYNFIDGVRTGDMYIGNHYNELSFNQNMSDNWQIANTATYNWITDTNNLTAMIGWEANKWTGAWVSAGANTFISQDQRVTSQAINDGSKTGSGGENSTTTMYSFFGRLSYSLMDRYLLTATIRKDRSSNFSPKHDTGIFPSFAAGWRVSEEDFMKDYDMITNLKLRAGWGQVGNAGLESGKWKRRMNSQDVWYQFYPEDAKIGQYSNRNKVAGMYKPELDTELKWETNEQLNFGVDLGLDLFGGELNVTADYFKRTTKDLLIYIAPRPSLGSEVNGIYTNNGTIENKGLEFTINYHKQINKDWGFTVGINGSSLKNEITDMPVILRTECTGGNDGSSIDGSNVQAVGGSAYLWDNHSISKKGSAVGSFNGYRVDGIFQTDEEAKAYVNEKGERIQPKAQAGDFKFKDLNNDGVLDDNDREVIGNGFPKFNYGINLNATYKDFDMSIFMYGVLGQDILSYSAMRLSDMIQGDEQTTVNILKDSYDKVARVKDGKVTNPGASLPRLSLLDDNRNSRISDAWVKNGNFLRISNVQIGYNVPRKLVRPLGINSVRAYAGVQNLALFSPYKKYGDPECGQGNVLFTGLETGRYPTPRTYTLGLSVTF